MITIIGGDFTRSWLSLPLSHGIKVKGGKIHFESQELDGVPKDPMENLGSKSDLGTFGFGGGLHSMTSNQGSRCHTSSSDSLAALAAPSRVKMSGRFREFHPDLFWEKGQKNMFSSGKKNTNIIKSNIERQQHISRRHPCFLVASLLCFRDFPQSQKKNTKTAPPSPLRCQKDEILGCIDVPALKAKDGRPKKRWSVPGKSWKITANHPTGGHTLCHEQGNLHVLPLDQPSIVQLWGMPDAAVLQAAFNHWTATN